MLPVIVTVFPLYSLPIIDELVEAEDLTFREVLTLTVPVPVYANEAMVSAQAERTAAVVPFKAFLKFIMLLLIFDFLVLLCASSSSEFAHVGFSGDNE